MAPISLEEISKAISKLKANKIPGENGFPLEWYGTFKEELIPLLAASFNWTLQRRPLATILERGSNYNSSQRRKKTEYCTNLRPIPVLNVDYKIYTSIIAQRYQKCINDLIDEDHTGFIAGCQTQDSIRRNIQIISTLQTNKNSAVLPSFDAEKAVDSVNWDFLCLVLE